MPDIVYRLQFNALAGGVWLDDARTDRHYLDAWELVDEVSHLHDEVHLHLSRAEPKHILKRLFYEMNVVRLCILFPCWRVHHQFCCCAVVGKHRCNALSQFHHVFMNETARVGGYEEMVGLGPYNAYVV